MTTKFKVFRAVDKQWYWHARRGACKVADSGGYNTKAGLLKSLRRFIDSLERGNYVIDENFRRIV